MARDHIHVNGLRLNGLIGVLPQERLAPQPLTIDLDLEVDVSSAGDTDNLEETAHYGLIADEVAALVRNSDFLLLERLATEIARVALAHSRVEVAHVRVTKMNPPIDEDLDSTAVLITRTRADFAVKSSHQAIVALGSNLGDRVAHLRFGISQLGNVVASSQVFETDPVGGPDNQGAYLNMVAIIETDLDPYQLMRRLHSIEAEAGRVREVHWGPRTLDLDIVMYDDVTIGNVASSDSGALTIPHPRFAERRFVLEPLSEVAPERCPSGWRESLPPMGVYPRGSLTAL
jgi:dihydroneopterin aldolase/2-amino-4-hydroxy-6-hydroxymethyldihydropteridine diphosphokinase